MNEEISLFSACYEIYFILRDLFISPIFSYFVWCTVGVLLHLSHEQNVTQIHLFIVVVLYYCKVLYNLVVFLQEKYGIIMILPSIIFALLISNLHLSALFPSLSVYPVTFSFNAKMHCNLFN